MDINEILTRAAEQINVDSASEREARVVIIKKTKGAATTQLKIYLYE